MPDSPLLRVLGGETISPPPMWIMRQAGRYLPEYRDVRSKAGSFLHLCYTPTLAAEVTLQPIRRFGFDAAIIFSDILVIPDALGAKVSFVEGEGPRLTPLTTNEDISALNVEGIEQRLSPVYEAISRVRADLPPQTALLGFCGAPWTVASYMIAGRGTSDLAPIRRMAYERPLLFEQLIDILVEASIRHLAQQLKAGADAVQIFDSWAGVLDEDGFRRWCVDPIRRIVLGLRREVPDARIIGFPKGAGMRTTLFTEQVPVNAIGVDWGLDLTFIRDRLQSRTAVQGNLDPLRLLAGGRALAETADEILWVLSGGPFIFNLGHGIVPDTPIPNVEALVARIRGG